MRDKRFETGFEPWNGWLRKSTASSTPNLGILFRRQIEEHLAMIAIVLGVNQSYNEEF